MLHVPARLYEEIWLPGGWRHKLRGAPHRGVHHRGGQTDAGVRGPPALGCAGRGHPQAAVQPSVWQQGHQARLTKCAHKTQEIHHRGQGMEEKDSDLEVSIRFDELQQ